MRTREIIKEQYKVIATKKTDPDTWIIKAVTETMEQARRFLDILTETANVYEQLKIETVTVHQIISAPKKRNART